MSKIFSLDSSDIIFRKRVDMNIHLLELEELEYWKIWGYQENGVIIIVYYIVTSLYSSGGLRPPLLINSS